MSESCDVACAIHVMLHVLKSFTWYVLPQSMMLEVTGLLQTSAAVCATHFVMFGASATLQGNKQRNS